MAISFLKANGVQAASASLLASSVKEGTLVYDDSDDALKVCDGTNWIEVGAGSSADTLAALSCTSGQIAKFNGAAWACAADGGSSQWSGVTGGLSYAFGGAVVGAGVLDASAILQADSTTKGFLPPRMTTAQRDAIASPATGLMIFNTTAAQYQFWNGSAWTGLGSGGVPTGTIAAFALASCPTGWTEYTAARGRFLRGIDNGAGNDPSGTRVPGSVQADDIKSHLHSVDPPSTSTSSAGTHSHDYNRPNITASYRNNLESGSNGNQTVTAGASTSTDGAHTHAVDIAAFDSAATGGVETRPKNVAVLFCQYSGSGGGGGGVTTLAALTDVDLSAVANGKVLTYNSATSKWEAETPLVSTPASPVNSVQFNNAGAFGGDAALTWDNTNKRLGIGTASPRSSLDVAGAIVAQNRVALARDATTTSPVWNLDNDGDIFRVFREPNFSTPGTVFLSILNTGNVGIGTTAPGRLLQVGSTDGIAQIGNMFSANISGDDGGHGVFGSNLYVDSTGALKTTGTHPSYGYSGMHSTWGALKFYTATGATTADAVVAPTARMTINTAGNVGIGTASPNAPLEVKGNAGMGETLRFAPAAASSEGGQLTLMDASGTGGWEIDNDGAGSLRFFRDKANAVNAMVLTQGGNVGIGTTAPRQKLDVVGAVLSGDATAPLGALALGINYTASDIVNTFGSSYSSIATALGYAVRPKNGSAGFVSSAGNSNFARGALQLTNELIFSNAAAATVAVGSDVAMTERFRITASGNVGIGTTSPGYRLTLGGETAQYPLAIYVGPTAHATSRRAAISIDDWGLLQDANGNGTKDFAIYQSSAASHRLFITTAGNVGIGTTNPTYRLQSAGQVAGAGAYVNTSDRRLKTNVHGLDYGLESVMRLRPVSFQWRDQNEDWQKGRKLGLIAQEAEGVVPEVVSTANDAMGTKSIAYGDLTPVLVKAVQELKAETDTLRVQLKAANDNYEELRREIEALKAAR